MKTNWQARAKGIRYSRYFNTGKNMALLLSLVIAADISNQLTNFVPMTGMQILAAFMVVYVVAGLVSDCLKLRG